jgi:hypothetical protein
VAGRTATIAVSATAAALAVTVLRESQLLLYLIVFLSRRWSCERRTLTATMIGFMTFSLCRVRRRLFVLGFFLEVAVRAAVRSENTLLCPALALARVRVTLVPSGVP